MQNVGRWQLRATRSARRDLGGIFALLEIFGG
jgi:hypothetical protein